MGAESQYAGSVRVHVLLMCLLQGHSTQILRRSCFLFLSTLAVLLSELPLAFHPAVWWGDFQICSPVWNSGVWKGCCKCWPKLTFTENMPRKGHSACNLPIYLFGKWFTLWLCSDCVPGKTTISQLISFVTVFLLICSLIWTKMSAHSCSIIEPRVRQCHLHILTFMFISNCWILFSSSDFFVRVCGSYLQRRNES